MFPMKTGGTNSLLGTADKTMLLSLSEAFVQEIIKILHVVCTHQPNIRVVDDQLMLKCIKYAVLAPDSIGAQMNQLLEFAFMETGDEKNPPTEIIPLVNNIRETYAKHYERLSDLENKFNETWNQPSYVRPTESQFVTKPLVNRLLADYFEGPDQEEGEEEEEGEEGEEEEEGEEGEEEYVVNCECVICAGVKTIGEIRSFPSGTGTNPFVEAIMSSMTKLDAEFYRQ